MAIPLIPLSIALSTGGAASGFGYLMLSTYEGKVLSFLQNKNNPPYKNYPIEPWKMSENIALQAIGKMRWYVVNKKANINDNKELLGLAKKIMLDLNMPLDSLGVRRMTAFLMSVRDDVKKTDGSLYSYIRGGLTDRDLIVKRLTSVSEKSTDLIEKTLPWFLKPRNILKIAIGGGLAYVGFVYVLPALKTVKKVSK